jgi:AcrR family transcriptional regulator
VGSCGSAGSGRPGWAAERLLRAEGPAALSHTALAKRLHLARAAIYWYFPTKDDLLVAAIADIFAADLGSPPEGGDLMTRLAWAVDRLQRLHPLIHVLHERAAHSEAAAELEAGFTEGLREGLRELLAPRVAPARLDLATKTIVACVEGLLAQRLSAAEGAEILEFLVEVCTTEP